MIWSCFPIALRFPVADESTETKRRCWAIALSALAAAPADTWEKLTLFELTASDIPGGAEREYLCVLHVYDVHFARRITETWQKLPQLYAHLVLHNPYWQQNPLDSYPEAPLLGTVRTDGTIERSEAAAAILPERLPDAMPVCGKRRILVTGMARPSAFGCDASLREVGLVIANTGADVEYLPYAAGGVGTAYALTYGQRGRFSYLPAKNTKDEPVRVLFGALPYGNGIFDAAALLTEDGAEPDSYALGTAVKAAMDRGFRKLILPMEGFSDNDGGEGFFRVFRDPDDPAKTDPRLLQMSFTLLTMNRALVDGSQMTNGLFFRLARNGAVIRYAPDTMQARLQLAKSCVGYDTLVVCGTEDDPVLDRILEQFEGKRIVRVPDGANSEQIRELLSEP